MAPELGSGILRDLDLLRTRFQAQLAEEADETRLRALKAELLGKKGELTGLLRGMAGVPAEERKTIGEAVNAAREAIESAFADRLAALHAAERARELSAAPFDLTMPARPLPRGHRHPVMQVKDEILDIFKQLGFQISWGPEVEFETNNFEKLAFP